MKIEFVSYSGAYPNLCDGILTLRVDGEIKSVPRALVSGGCVRFDDDWLERIEKAAWRMSAGVPQWMRDNEADILAVVNRNVPWGCCGGCV